MQQVDDRQGMPRSVVVAPVLMLVFGAVASVGLWILLNQGPALLVRSGGGVGGLPDSARARP